MNYKDEGYQLIGAAFEVYNEMGGGLLEEIYQECLEMELETRKIPFESRVSLGVHYKGRPLTKRYIPDLLVYREILVELKAVTALLPEHDAQLLNYMRITRKTVGYLINFANKKELEWKRFVLTGDHGNH